MFANFWRARYRLPAERAGASKQTYLCFHFRFGKCMEYYRTSSEKNPFSVVFCCPERRTGQLLATVLPPRHNKAIPHNNAPLLVLLAGEVAEAAEDAVEALSLDLCPPLSRAFSAFDLKKNSKRGQGHLSASGTRKCIVRPQAFLWFRMQYISFCSKRFLHANSFQKEKPLQQ